MNLPDIIRERTSRLITQIKDERAVLKEAHRNQTVEEETEQKLREESNSLQAQWDEGRTKVAFAKAEVQRIQREIIRLEEQKNDAQLALDEAEEECQGFEGPYKQKRNDIKSHKQKAEGLAITVENIEQKIDELNARLAQERVSSFKEYINRLWEHLSKLDHEAEASKDALEALQRLNNSRHEDPKIAELWEARHEWLRIVNSAGPTIVRRTAEDELNKIENTLDSLFPNALSVKVIGSPDDLSELFVWPLQGNEACILPLPIPNEIFASINEGKVDDDCNLAARIIWGFVKSFPWNTSESTAGYVSRFKHSDDLLMLCIEKTSEEVQSADPVNIGLGGGGRVTFIISERPSELQEFINHEHHDS